MEKKITAKALNEACMYALPEELAAIRRLYDSLGHRRNVVMLGAGPGVFAVAICENRQDFVPMWIVDHETTQYAKAHLEACECDTSGLRYYTADSADFAFADHWQFMAPALLIVDADHTYEGVKRDINAWLQVMWDVPDAKFFFHDYLEREGGFSGHGEWKESGVAKAIADFPQLKIIDRVGISVICEFNR